MTEKKLNHLKLKNTHLNKLNEYLNNIKNNTQNDTKDIIENNFFQILEKYIKNGKTIYKKYGKTKEQKEKILILIIKNILKLLNELNIRRVHNSSMSLEKDYYDYKNLKQLKDFFRIRGLNFLEDNKKGFSCNNLNVWLYGLIKDITNNDSDLKINFELNKKDNHGKLIIKINNKKFFINTNDKGIFLEKKEKNKKFKKEYKEIHDYKKAYIKGQINKKSLTYQYGKYQIKFIRIGNYIIFFFRKTPIKNSIIPGTKRIYKLSQKIIKAKKLFFKKGKFKNKNELFDFIKTKFSKDESKIIIQAINNFYNKKIEQFL